MNGLPDKTEWQSIKNINNLTHDDIILHPNLQPVTLSFANL